MCKLHRRCRVCKQARRPIQPGGDLLETPNSPEARADVLYRLLREMDPRDPARRNLVLARRKLRGLRTLTRGGGQNGN